LVTPILNLLGAGPLQLFGSLLPGPSGLRLLGSHLLGRSNLQLSKSLLLPRSHHLLLVLIIQSLKKGLLSVSGAKVPCKKKTTIKSIK
jgi:hypothetical protein